MAEEEKQKNEKQKNEEQELEEEIQVEEKQSKFNMKIILFGLPVFILQLVVVYFITANILLSRFKHSEVNSSEMDGQTEAVEEDTSNTSEFGKYVYSVKDVIVNPAGTEGNKLLLTSVGFDVPTEESIKKLEEKEIAIKDMVISVLSRKSLRELKKWSYKDSLRVEIAENIKRFVPDVKINKIYFSKFIIQ